MNTTYINIFLTAAAIVVPIGLGALLIELRAWQERSSRNRDLGHTPDCGIMNPNHSINDK